MHALILLLQKIRNFRWRRGRVLKAVLKHRRHRNVQMFEKPTEEGTGAPEEQSRNVWTS